MKHGNENSKSMLLFLARIQVGCGVELDLIDIIKDGLHITGELLDEFIL